MLCDTEEIVDDDVIIAELREFDRMRREGKLLDMIIVVGEIEIVKTNTLDKRRTWDSGTSPCNVLSISFDWGIYSKSQGRKIWVEEVFHNVSSIKFMDFAISQCRGGCR